MEPRLDLLTLGVADLDAARHFYVDGLGWQPVFEVPGEVVFIQVGHSRLLGLFGAADLEVDIGAAQALATGPPPMSLAQIVETEQEVVDIVAQAEAAGATVLKTPQHAEFGGFHAYFVDPSGFHWEIATNPGFWVEADGRVHLGPIGD